MKAFAEISESGDRVDVHFPYDPQAVLAVKTVPGARFVPKDKGGPMWRMPLDLTTARRLREAFGEFLTLGDALKEWGRIAVRKENSLRSLAVSDDAQLERLPKALPELAAWLRPYQRADIAFMSETNVINANQPGTGKTVEAIGAVFEAGMDGGAQLVVAPKTSLEVVWQFELERWQPHPVLVTSGDDSVKKRQETIERALELYGQDKPFWLVLNPAFVRYQRDKMAEKVVVRGREEFPLVPVHPELFQVDWTTVVFDEYHKMGLSNPKTQLAQAANDIKAEKKVLLSGTPMGGKPIKLWGALHFLHPESFTSKWRWADQWLEVTDNGYGKEIHGIRPGREDEFYQHLAPHMVRRTKEEILPQLPAKQFVDIWCEMTAKQRKQYETFAADAEMRIDEQQLSATSILAEYTRLRQFADAHQRVEKHNDSLKVLPQPESGKLPHILALLEERGITAEDPEGDEQVVIASQFSGVVDMIHAWLNEQGIAAEKITGSVTTKERSRIVREFQADGGARVIVMTTTAGGVSVTLDKASTVIIVDETWNPDDQEQLEDRVHRASRIHQVTCYYLRSKGTIEEFVQNLTLGKRITNREILDLRRQGFRAVADSSGG